MQIHYSKGSSLLEKTMKFNELFTVKYVIYPHTTMELFL